jgi:hypothetical protein
MELELSNELRFGAQKEMDLLRWQNAERERESAWTDDEARTGTKKPRATVEEIIGQLRSTDVPAAWQIDDPDDRGRNKTNCVSWVSMPRFIFLGGVNVVGLFVVCLKSHRAKSRLNMTYLYIVFSSPRIIKFQFSQVRTSKTIHYIRECIRLVATL